MRYHPMKSGTYTISSGFGKRGGSFHYGLDFAAEDGTPIYAAQAGKVVHIGVSGSRTEGFGHWIVIDHPAENGAGTTVYGHMWDAFATGLKQGDWVEAGQLIAFVGSNGGSTGPHLHFEVHPTVWKAKSQIDPKGWLQGVSDPGAPMPPRAERPRFTEYNVISNWRGKPYGQSQPRNGQKVRYIVLHTSEGAGGAGLLDYMQRNKVSYHYVVDDTGENNATVWDLVDTDRAAWSVGNANNYTINVCFGTSFAHKHSRQDWLRLQDDSIRAAAYIIAQDCRKYNIPPVVRMGSSAGGYPSLKNNTGVTDHRGINTLVGGSHTDVGDQFPVDVFNNYLQKYYYGGANDMADVPQAEWDLVKKLVSELHGALFNRVESTSIYADPDEGPRWQLHELIKHGDKFKHEEWVEDTARQGVADSIRRILAAALGEGKYKDAETRSRAAEVLDTIPEDLLEAYEAKVKK